MTPKPKDHHFHRTFVNILRGHCQADEIKTNRFLSILIFTELNGGFYLML